MSYTMYTPLNVWLDPASMTDVVAYIQNYLSNNPIYSTAEIETLIHDYLIAHPELIGGVQSVNGKTGTVVLSASDINTENNVTIESVLASLSSQISSIAASVATNTNNITALTGRMSTAETDLSNLKSNFSPYNTASEYYQSLFTRNALGVGIGLPVTVVSSTIRLVIPVLQFTSSEITATANTGYNVGFCTCSGANIALADSGWRNSVTIPANTYFHMSFRKSNNSEITLEEIVNLTFTNADFKFLQPELNNITRGLVYYKPSTFVQGVGHRGIYDAPENTLIGFKYAKLKGFNWVECDVQFTSDNIPVLLHDVSINRTARNADGSTISTTINVNSVTYSQLQNYDFGIYKGSQFAGTKIPTLNEFVSLCRSIGLCAYIEIKNNVSYSQAQLESIVDIVKSYNMDEYCVYYSFSSDYLSTIHQYDPDASLGLSVQTDITDSMVTTVNSLRTNNKVYIGALYENVTDAGINKLISAKIPLIYWTMNDAHLMIAANGYVSGFISDTTNAESVLFNHAITL